MSIKDILLRMSVNSERNVQGVPVRRISDDKWRIYLVDLTLESAVDVINRFKR